MQVTFSLLPVSTKYSAVRLRIYDVGTVPPTLVVDDLIGNTVVEYTAQLTEGRSYQAVLTKSTAGVAGNPSVLNFSTGGAVSFPSGDLRIIAVEEESSSSSLSSSSVSSVSSSSSLSSSSSSSSSTSSSSRSSLSSSSSTSSKSSASSLSSSSSSSSGTSQSSLSSSSSSSLSSASSASSSSSSSS